MLDKDVKHAGYTRIVDLWAFGCMLFEMLTGKSAFGKSGDPTHAIYMRIMSGRINVPARVSREATDLIKNLLTSDVGKRLCSIEAIKAHPWFSDVDWVCFEQRRVVPPFAPALAAPGDHQYFDTYSVSVDPQTASRWDKLRREVAPSSAADFATF